MRVALIVFLVSLASSILARVLRGTPVSRATALEHAPLIKLLVTARATDNWNALLWNAARSASSPQSILFGIVIECDTVEDADVRVDTLLRAHTRIDYATAAPSASRAMRRLVRRFVDGSEAVVVIVHRKATLVARWDEVVTQLAPQLGDAVASAPPAGAVGAPRFPTLRQTSDGCVARDVARVFKSERAELVPSVCWCPEVTFARPATLRAWPRATRVDDGRAHLVPGVPLLEKNDDLEDELLDDESARSRTPRVVLRCETAGLTTATTAAEAALKYGSARAAKMAARLGTR